MDNRLYRPFDLYQAPAIGFAVVAVQFVDVAAVSDLVGVGGGVVALAPGRAVVVTYQAGEVEEGAFPAAIPAEVQVVARGA